MHSNFTQLTEKVDVVAEKKTDVFIGSKDFGIKGETTFFAITDAVEAPEQQTQKSDSNK